MVHRRTSASDKNTILKTNQMSRYIFPKFVFTFNIFNKNTSVLILWLSFNYILYQTLILSKQCKNALVIFRVIHKVI